MANATTTHVIEIETGIGEPAFVPLALGQELQPISVGKKGMWRIESPRVLDVHAFVYFDGHSLFVQSADEAHPASVDGNHVGKAWTELHSPCTIEVGLARLRYRSLLGDDKEQTEVSHTPPAHAPTAAPGSGRTRPGASMPVAVAVAPPPRMPRPSTQPRPEPTTDPLTSPTPAVSFPKADRPFKPGEFSSAASVDESTRIAPLEATGGGRGRPPSHASSESGERPDARTGRGMEQAPMGGAPPPFAHGPPPGYEPQPPPNYVHPPPYLPPMQGHGGSVATGGYGSMGPQGMPQAAPPPASALPAGAKQSSAVKMAIVAGVLFAVLGVVFLVVRRDDPLARRTTLTTAEGGTIVVSSSPPVTSLPPWPPGVACPPANWPPDTPLPCTPNGISANATAPVDPHPSSKPKDTKEPAGGRSLERQAVDFVAAGETAKAIAAYDDLVRRDPNNKVYAEAARILRAKLDAGLP